MIAILVILVPPIYNFIDKGFFSESISIITDYHRQAKKDRLPLESHAYIMANCGVLC